MPTKLKNSPYQHDKLTPKKIMKFILKILSIIFACVVATYMIIGVEILLSEFLRQPVSLVFFMLLAWGFIIFNAGVFYRWWGEPQFDPDWVTDEEDRERERKEQRKNGL